MLARRRQAEAAARFAQEAVAPAPPPKSAPDRCGVLLDAAAVFSLTGKILAGNYDGGMERRLDYLTLAYTHQSSGW